MAYIELDFESQYYGGNTQVSILMPDRDRAVNNAEFFACGKKYPVLWLLHGTHGDHTDWLRKSKVEVYSRERELIVVMPSVQNSDYTNWPGFGTGYDSFRMIRDELVPLVHHWLPASDRPEDNFVAGLSMGGGGALKFALNCPDIFGAGAVLSYAPRDIDTPEDLFEGAINGDNSRLANTLKNAGGVQAYRDSIDNSFRQVMQLHEAGRLPKLYFCIGTEDFLYDPLYVPFKRACQEKGIDIHFEEEPGMGHEWRFWDPYIEKSMDFFGIPKVPYADSFRGLKGRKFL